MPATSSAGSSGDDASSSCGSSADSGPGGLRQREPTEGRGNDGRQHDPDDDLVERLDEAFGSKPWAVAADSGGQSLCDDGRRAFLPRRQFPGAYDAASFEKVRDLVIEVGKEHGFAEPTLLLEKPGYLEIVAPDETGGEYSFVMGEKTSVVTSTGCHPVG
jgi:hypothetical protein